MDVEGLATYNFVYSPTAILLGSLLFQQNEIDPGQRIHVVKGAAMIKKYSAQWYDRWGFAIENRQCKTLPKVRLMIDSACSALVADILR